MWPPILGKPLPRADEAWVEPRKWKWILGEEGHGKEWKRVFRVPIADPFRVWGTVAAGLPNAPIVSLRMTAYGYGCGMLLYLTLDDRHSHVMTAWHYAQEGAAPRLVTAYPTTYTRSNGKRT
jgi:hypothetical protein